MNAVTPEGSCAFLSEHLNLNTAIQCNPVRLIFGPLFPKPLHYKKMNSRNKNYSYHFTAAPKDISDASLRILERGNQWVNFIKWD